MLIPTYIYVGMIMSMHILGIRMFLSMRTLDIFNISLVVLFPCYFLLILLKTLNSVVYYKQRIVSYDWLTVEPLIDRLSTIPSPRSINISRNADYGSVARDCSF